MIDRLILAVDRALRTLAVPPPIGPTPADGVPDVPLGEPERRHAAALMRIDHVGEVCAQALYQGQALVCQDAAVRHVLHQAADEEVAHLDWTARRIAELGGRRSLLNPLWYAGSLALGMVAGRVGDGWNLGFLAETERQVEAHLDRHLDTLPPADLRSRAILEQMRADERRHADTAVRLGGTPLPAPVRYAMTAMSKLMTVTAYRI